MFILLACLMALVATLVCVYPLFRAKNQDLSIERQKRIEVIAQKLKEIDADVESGLIEENMASSMKKELSEAMAQGDSLSAEKRQRRFGTSIAFRLTLVCFIPLVSLAIYFHIGDPAFVFGLDKALRERAIAQAYPELDLPLAVEKLYEHVENNPTDGKALELLFKSLMTLQRHDEAVAVMAKLRLTRGDHPDLLVMHAEAIALENGQGMTGESLELIEKALEIDSEHQVALLLLAIAAENRGDFGLATSFYERAERTISDPTQRSRIESLRKEASAKTASAGSIKLLVQLDPAIAASIDPSHALFVYARQVNGPPMPIAVARLQASELPANVTLDDSNSMTSATKLSSFMEVDVIARISSTGNASPSSGEPQGKITKAQVGQDTVITLTINDRVP